MGAEVDHHRLRARFQLRHGNGGPKHLRDLSEVPMLKPTAVENFRHEPVLLGAVHAAAGTIPPSLLADGLLVDVTLGSGGHSACLLQTYPGLRLIGLDQDGTARAAAEKRLAPFQDRVRIVASNFAIYHPVEQAVMVLADLGVSSAQLDVASRGFSFRKNGPLDMRMDQQSGGETAASLIQRLDETSLANLIYAFGEEKFSRRIARRIKSDLSIAGPYSGTVEFAHAIVSCFPPSARRGRTHPATRTFQALRIAVNSELSALESLLRHAPGWLQPQGVIGIISFHSLEDRLVKRAFLEDLRLEPITRKPVRADPEEQVKNPRSRSARWRLAKRRLFL
ncbi:16S rRNA (cytosine(1402)-N(4))-methyltransferase RsmH [cyanobiont of Ornithocercus magnificus]|nr:16S rRNA (cytosine(1402)-N(4))-methyltransferase RsmH [cyanobiont of Ornithocercus magnificus]